MADPTSTDINAFLGEKPVPKWRRWAKWAGILVAVIVLGLVLKSCFGGSDAVQYSTVPAAQGALRVTVSATGKLAPINQVTVGSETSGLITRVTVDVNDRVTAGQALALIDPSQLDDDIRQNQAQLAANQAQVSQAEATVQESRAQLSRLQEVSRLSGGRVPAKTEMETAIAAVARAVAAVRVAQANVVASRASLNSSQTRRARAIIRSPVNGVVLARQVEPGQTVAASFNTPTLFVIAEDLTTMELQVAIDEADVGEVKDGQRATFTVDAFPGRTFPAKITRVDLGSNLSASTTTTTTTTASTVVSYAATLAVSNPDQQLRPGMTATAEIVTSEKTNVLLVPNAALRFTPATTPASGSGGITSQLVPKGPRRGAAGPRTATVGRGAAQTIYVVGEDGKPKPVSITTGDTNGSMTEVTGGELKPGMQVITGQLATGAAAGSGGQRRQGAGAGAGGARAQ
jgi:HlyD family secretion protein